MVRPSTRAFGAAQMRCILAGPLNPPHPEQAKRVEGRMMLPLLLALFVPALACAEPAAPWPDTVVSRLEALALIETLNAEILASRSATFALEKWCVDHRLSGDAEPKILARQGNDKAKPAT